MKLGREFIVFAIILIVSKIRGSDAGKCYQCDDCLAVPAPITDANTCPSTSKCFTSVDENGKIKRGCLSDTMNCDEKDNSCRSCDAKDELCNKETEEKELFWCTTCNSTNDANCANVKKASANNFCKVGVTKCLTQIKDKVTHRRCASTNDEQCLNAEKCNPCDKRSCNNALYPADRRKCYQCNSGDSSCGNPTAEKSYACQLYEESDSCYLYGTSDIAMNRGCKSDQTEFEKCPNGKCKVCTSDNCNNQTFTVPQTLKCIQCSSEKVANCALKQKTEDAKDCKNIEYWQNQGCYLNRLGSGKVERGCLQEFNSTATCSNTNSCNSCETDGCNVDELLEFSCYKCRSDRNNKCADKLKDNSYKSEQCRMPILTAADKKCYVENYNGVVYRSCIVDTDQKTRAKCLNDKEKSCTTCDTANCNDNEAPNSAYGIALVTGLLAGCLLFLQFF